MTVAPVVVRPLMASNMASARPRRRLLKMKGRAANPAVETQATTVSMKAWRLVRLGRPLGRAPKIRARATKAETMPATAKTFQSTSPANRSTTAGIPMAAARTSSRKPLTKRTGRTSIKSSLSPPPWR